MRTTNQDTQNILKLPAVGSRQIALGHSTTEALDFAITEISPVLGSDSTILFLITLLF